jgi:hypothetical protein
MSACLRTRYEDYLEPILTALTLSKLFFLLVVLGHLMACAWYYCGAHDEIRADEMLVRGWVWNEEWGEHVDTWSRYVVAYMHVLSDLVPGIAGTQNERLIALALHLLYEVFFGFLTGTFATIVMAGRASQQQKDQKISAVREIATMAGVPLKKKKVIRSFYEYLYRHKSIFNQEVTISSYLCHRHYRRRYCRRLFQCVRNIKCDRRRFSRSCQSRHAKLWLMASARMSETAFSFF